MSIRTSEDRTPIRHRRWRYTGIVGALLSTLGFYLYIIDMAALIDGPRVGIFAEHGSFGSFMLLWLGGLIVFVCATDKAPGGLWAGGVFAAGLVFLVILFASRAGSWIYHLTWPEYCAKGNAHFCYAAARLTKEDDWRWRDYHQRGCQIAGQSNRTEREHYSNRRWGLVLCTDLLRTKGLDATTRAAACVGLAGICEAEKQIACANVRERCTPITPGNDRQSCKRGEEICAGDARGCRELANANCQLPEQGKDQPEPSAASGQKALGTL